MENFSAISYRITLLCLYFLLSAGALMAQDKPISWDGVLVEQTTHTVSLENPEWEDGQHVSFDYNGETIQGIASDGRCDVEVFIPNDADFLLIKGPEFTFSSPVKTIPLWFSILPPLLAIILAFWLKEVNTALFSGVVLGAVLIGWFTYDSNGLFWGLLDSVGVFLLDAVADPGHMSIIVFSLMIGALVAIITKNGSMQDLVKRIVRDVKSRRSVQLYTWLMGVVIFFDDYSNTLVVGNTMRTLTDRMKVSREKLAYIVDSTAAPIASIAFITTWIGAEVGYIADSIAPIEAMKDTSAYSLFLGSIPYSFYPIFTLGFVLMLVWSRKDYGPMLSAEKKALTMMPHGDHETQDKTKLTGKWYMAVIPIMFLIGGVFVFLLITGYDANLWSDPNTSFLSKLSITIGQSDAYAALLWSSFLALLAAILLNISIGKQRIQDTIETFNEGIKSMMPALIILTLAWAIASVTSAMHTADFLIQLIGEDTPIWLLPAITFVLSGIVAFATGSSWGTMAILYPIVVPAVHVFGTSQGMEEVAIMSIMLNTISTVLSGSVLGDHCSPLSDTTILSSLACKCDHIAHVKTQMPYALTVGLVAVFIGTIPAALGMPIWAIYIIGFGLLYIAIRYLGKNPELT